MDELKKQKTAANLVYVMRTGITATAGISLSLNCALSRGSICILFSPDSHLKFYIITNLH
jgi:hypothetical protein